MLRGPSLCAMLMVGTGCGASHGADAGRAFDAGPDPSDAGRIAADANVFDAGRVERPDSGPHDATALPPAGTAVCGGLVCAVGEECCILYQRCIPIGDPSCAPPEGSGPRACTRMSDCALGEVCGIPDGVDAAAHCGGYVGNCVNRGSDCGGLGDGVCGCDGRTYANPCEANAAGVEVGAQVPCGTIIHYPRQMCDSEHPLCPGHMHCDPEMMWCIIEEPLYACGIDAQCPVDQYCCGYTGTCVDPARPFSCGPIPEGAHAPCTDDVDCQRHDGAYWEDYRPPPSFCGGPGCGPGGGCIRIPSDCVGVLEPVCGCDGQTYWNECEAARASVRVARIGEC